MFIYITVRHSPRLQTCGPAPFKKTTKSIPPVSHNKPITAGAAACSANPNYTQLTRTHLGSESGGWVRRDATHKTRRYEDRHPRKRQGMSIVAVRFCCAPRGPSTLLLHVGGAARRRGHGRNCGACRCVCGLRKLCAAERGRWRWR